MGPLILDITEQEPLSNNTEFIHEKEAAEPNELLQDRSQSEVQAIHREILKLTPQILVQSCSLVQSRLSSTT